MSRATASKITRSFNHSKDGKTWRRPEILQPAGKEMQICQFKYCKHEGRKMPVAQGTTQKMHGDCRKELRAMRAQGKKM